MNRRNLALAFGFAFLLACGDNAPRLLSDASPPPNPDAPAPDAAAPDAPPDAPPDAAIPPLRLLQYSFEEASTTVMDSSGRGLDGTLNDTASWTPDGRTGRGIALAGGNPARRFVSLPSGVLTNVNDFTISVWVKLNSIAMWARIFDLGDGPIPGANHWMFLTVHGATPGTANPPNVDDGIHATSFSGVTPAGETFVGSNTQLPLNVWKHLTLTGSGGDRQLYIDGFPVASETGGTTVPPSAMEPLGPNSWLGRSRFELQGDPAGPRDPGLDGTLDDFRIYSKVLTQPEIADLAWPQHDYSYWRFDEASGETTKDSSDNNIATVLMNGATRTTGVLGGAIDLPGADGGGPPGPHVALASSPLQSCTTQLTVALWVKLRAINPFTRIFDFGTGPATFIFLAATDGGGIRLGMGKEGMPAFDLTASQPVPPDNAWHHVALTIDPTGLVNIYLDGAPVATPTQSMQRKPSDYATTDHNYIGRSQFVADRFLDGAIDELRISCRAFTGDEIKNLSRRP